MTTAEKKIVQHRLSTLQLAEALGNASEACRRRGFSRIQFYEYKRRLQYSWFGRSQGFAADPQEPPSNNAS